MTAARKHRRKRRVIGAVAVLVVLAATGLFVRASAPLVSIGLAYKAKTLCSEIFVAGRHVADVQADLAIDDLRPLRMIPTTVDTSAMIATAHFLVASRKARFVPEFGCTLSPWTTVIGNRGEALPTLPQSGQVGLETNSTALQFVLDSAFAEPDATRLKRTRAIVVLYRGKVVAERYAPGIGPETPLPGWSMTKSVLNALVGVAVRQGELRLEEATKLQAWSEPGDDRARITIDDLLRMSSGLEFDEDQARASSDVVRMLYGAADMAGFASSKSLVAEPGQVWSYSSGSSLILSQVLRERLGERAYRSFPRRMLFEPLGLTRAVMEVDGAGTFVASSYMYATAREWALFGQLYLQDGMWKGERILPAGWVAYTTTPAAAGSFSTYGAHFWLSAPAEYRGPSESMPPGIFHAVGHEAQFVTIVPSHDAVIVRLGKTRYPSTWEHDRFVAAVLRNLSP